MAAASPSAPSSAELGEGTTVGVMLGTAGREKPGSIVTGTMPAEGPAGAISRPPPRFPGGGSPGSTNGLVAPAAPGRPFESNSSTIDQISSRPLRLAVSPVAKSAALKAVTSFRSTSCLATKEGTDHSSDGRAEKSTDARCSRKSDQPGCEKTPKAIRHENPDRRDAIRKPPQSLYSKVFRDQPRGSKSEVFARSHCTSTVACAIIPPTASRINHRRFDNIPRRPSRDRGCARPRRRDLPVVRVSRSTGG